MFKSESSLDHLVSEGVPHELADGMHLQFAHDIGSMRLCCFDADAQSDGHLFAAFAFSQKLNDLPFARTQAYNRDAYVSEPLPCKPISI
jgi:hypothetical protein